MTTKKNATRLVAAALASALAISSAAVPAFAFAETQPSAADSVSLRAASGAISPEEAGKAAASWIGWSWADVDYATTTLVYDAWGYPDYYVVDISAFFTSDIYTVCVDAYTGAIL